MSINKYQPNFSDPRVQKRLARCLGFTLSSLSTSESKKISKNYLDKVFGSQNHPLSNYFRRVLLITTNNLFVFVPGDPKRGVCKEYKANQEGIDRLLPKLDASKISAKLLASVHTYYPYCSTSLVSPSATMLAGKVLALEYAKENFQSEVDKGNLKYKDRANRLWHPVQQLKKGIKQTIYKDAGMIYEYDIDACAPTLLLQLAKRNGLKKSPTIDFYLKNKTEIRTRISKEAEIDVKDAKQIITALFSGAQLSKSIGDILNKDTARIEWFKQDDFITKLRKDITKMWRVLNPVVNHSKSVRLSSRVKWAAYFSLERQVLDVVANHLKSTKNKCVLEHDGWTCESPIADEALLISEIKQQTNFDVTFTKKVITSASIVPW